MRLEVGRFYPGVCARIASIDIIPPTIGLGEGAPGSYLLRYDPNRLTAEV